jgi:hypothetical protein
MPKRNYPGRRTREQWQALSRKAREDFVRRAQCDLFGSFRHCRNKRCLRARTCCGDEPSACYEKLWRLTKKKPKTLRNAVSRLHRLADA